MQDFSTLSDVEFETLCADLMSRELGVHVERFPAGRDRGIDLRWEDENGQGIGQCKHYVHSSFSDLNRAAAQEVSKVEALSPSKYKFFTSRSLTVTQKETLFERFSPWMESEGDVYGAEDIDLLLRRHESVQRAHPKLWLHSGTQLFLSLNSDIHNLSRDLVARAGRDMARFVATDSFTKAREILSEEHVCVIAGSPGVGKTMLAHALVADAASDGFDIYEVNSDVREAWRLYDSNAKQLFLYDDFLGQISLRERLEKNEDKGIVRFMETVAATENHRFVLTTREYILREATSSFAALKEIGERRRFLLEVPSYSQVERAKILYNHVWHSKLPGSLRAQFAQGGWKEVVNHHGFNPRLIQYATGDLLVSQQENYLKEFVAILDKPTKLWEEGYDHQIREEQRVLLRVLCLFNEAKFEDLINAVVAHGAAGVQLSNRTIENALRELDLTFIAVRKMGDSYGVKFHSPAVREFILDLLRTDQHALLQVVNSAQNIDQLLHLSRAGLAATSTNPVTGKTTLISSDPLPLRTIRTSFVERVVTLFETSTSNTERALAGISSLEPSLLPDREWWTGKLRPLSLAWERGEGDLEYIEEIVTSRPVESLPDEFSDALKESARSRVEHYDFVEPAVWNSAINIFEDVLGEDLPQEFGVNFLYFVESGALNDFSEGEFSEIGEVASRLGDEQAERYILQKEAEIYGEPDWDDDREARYSGGSSSYAEPALEELDNLFDRFVN